VISVTKRRDSFSPHCLIVSPTEVVTWTICLIDFDWLIKNPNLFKIGFTNLSY